MTASFVLVAAISMRNGRTEHGSDRRKPSPRCRQGGRNCTIAQGAASLITDVTVYQGQAS